MSKSPSAQLDPKWIEPSEFHVHAKQPVIIHGDGFVEKDGGKTIVVDLVKLDGGITQTYLNAVLDKVEKKIIKLTVPVDKFSHGAHFDDSGMTVTVTNPNADPATQTYPMTFSATVEADCGD